MPNYERTILTLAEVCELQPGDKDNPSWINDGVRATVGAIAPAKPTKTGGKMWACTLVDPDNGAQAEMALFTAPKFSVGDTIEVTGQGMRRDDFKGKAQIKISQKTEIHVVDSAPASRQTHAEPLARSTESAPPAASPHSQAIYGATVGAGINQAMEVFRYIYSPDELREMIKTPSFWQALHELASDFCRVAIILEAGKVAPKIKDRVPSDFEAGEPLPAAKTPTQSAKPASVQGTDRSEPARQATKPRPGPDQSVALEPNEEDVPF